METAPKVTWVQRSHGFCWVGVGEESSCPWEDLEVAEVDHTGLQAVTKPEPQGKN